MPKVHDNVQLLLTGCIGRSTFKKIFILITFLNTQTKLFFFTFFSFPNTYIYLFQLRIVYKFPRPKSATVIAAPSWSLGPQTYHY